MHETPNTILAYELFLLCVGTKTEQRTIEQDALTVRLRLGISLRRHRQLLAMLRQPQMQALSAKQLGRPGFRALLLLTESGVRSPGVDDVSFGSFLRRQLAVILEAQAEW